MQRAGQTKVADFGIWGHGLQFAQFDNGLGVKIAFGKSRAKILPHFEAFRIQTLGFAKFANGRSEIALLEKCETQIVVNVHIARIKGDGFLILRNGVVQIPLVVKQ